MGWDQRRGSQLTRWKPFGESAGSFQGGRRLPNKGARKAAGRPAGEGALGGEA